jgi:hypothetical protein
MARCPECGVSVPTDARECRVCGARLGSPARQTELLFGPLHASLYAGAGAEAVPAPASLQGLSVRQVIIAVGAVLLVLLGFIWYAGQPAGRSAGGMELPVMGVMGEPVRVGDTVWGVAFTDSSETFSGRTPERGRFLVVGIVTGNHSTSNFPMNHQTTALLDAASGTRYTPTFTAWGTPDDFPAGKYAPTYTLAPYGTIAGILLFDVPVEFVHPRLLVRDLARDEVFTGLIDLERDRRGRLQAGM